MSNLHPAGAGMGTSGGAGTSTNRLAGEASPYLQQHARNPVDWFPWGPEALARARAEDKPILLSIGYSACHWCHVMERESFEDAAIAAQMNEGFVSIKVDREERPDLDQIYQLVVQLMGRNGGWPLTVFLTPDQKPFFGGTYFPPADRYGMPGFSKILAAVSDAYRARRDEVDAQAKELTAAIASVTAVEKPRGDAYAPGPDLLERAVQKLSLRFDDANGGLGTRPKFPNTMALDVFLRRGALEGDARSLGRTKLALDSMRGGGIYDQLGHGFHRYSTDERWLVPHFEKMLYDNALLLRVYTDAFRATEEPRFAATARAIAAYVEREMTDVDGGFYATQDADSEGEEGRFFVWSPAEIDAALAGDEEAAAVAKLHWGVTPEGNFEESGKTVLHVARPAVDLAVHLGKAPSAIEEAIERARRKLFAVREGRPRPFRDEKILVSWNALMIGALADAGAALGQPALVALADRAFRFLEAKLVSGEGAATRVERHCKGGVVKGPGFLDDYAFLADAALDLFEATGDAHHVTRARGLADAILARFWDATDGGFFFTPEGGEALIHRAKDPFDHAIPSGTSMACKALLRLSVLVDARYAEAATRQLESIAPAAVENPFGFGQTLGVLDRLVRGSVDVVIAGDAIDPRARALHDVALHAYLPNRNVAWLRDADARAACALLAEGKAPGKDGAVAYVCRGRTCSLPLSTPEALRDELRRARVRG